MSAIKSTGLKRKTTDKYYKSNIGKIRDLNTNYKDYKSQSWHNGLQLDIMIFKKIEAIKYHQNLNRVLKNSQNSYTEREGYIIKLYFDDYCGYGEASPLPFFSRETIKQVEWSIEELKAGLAENQRYNTEELLTVFEIFSKDCPSLNFALDIALYDILSKRENL